MMKRRLGAVMLTTGLFLGSVPFIQAAPIKLTYDGRTYIYNEPVIELYINNQKVETKVMPPIKIDSRVLVPAREVFEPLGAKVEWEPEEKKVKVYYKQTEIVLKVNEKKVLVNNEVHTLDVPAKIINQKIMIPIRFISETIGFNVEWKGDRNLVYINDTKDSQTVIPDSTPEANKPEINVPSNREDENQTENSKNEITAQISHGNYISSLLPNQIYLPKGDYKQTQIKSVQVSQQNEKNISLIKADSTISSAQVQVQKGKLIVDIKNATSDLKSSIAPGENTYIKAIRTSQYTTDTVRVVYDLASVSAIDIGFNENRTAIHVRMQPQYIEQIRVMQQENKDSLFIKGISLDQLETKIEGSLLTFKVPNSRITQPIEWKMLNQKYIKSVTVKQGENGVEGTVLLDENCTYQPAEDSLGVYLQISKKSYTNNVFYESSTRPQLILQQLSVPTEQLKIQDLYREKKIIVDLGADYSSVLGSETMKINDGKVNNIVIETKGTTKVIFNTASIYALNIDSEKDKLRLELLKPYEKYDKIVVLDPGHGGSDSGAVGNGLTEKQMNLNQFKALYERLQKDSNIKVYTTRESDVYPSLQYRTEMANDIGADLFVSIHNNSGPSQVTGTETLYFPSSTDSRGKEVAKLVQNSIVNSCHMNNRGIKARSDLYVLRTSKMPAILIETGFISNSSEAHRINSEPYLSTWGNAVYQAIVKAFDIL